jgi:hypothetical protein
MASKVEIRQDLEELIVRDLLGPWDGETEKIKSSPKSRYLVGMLAPVVHNPQPQKASDDGQDGDDEVAVIGEGSSANTGDEVDEDSAASGLLMHPSSMGLRCQVSNETSELQVVARWGHYESGQVAGEGEEGSRGYSREQIEVSTKIDLTKAEENYDFPEFGARIHVEVHSQGNRKIIEISLMNMKKHEKTAPVQSWMFQAGFDVSTVSGDPVFLPTDDVLEKPVVDPDAEVQHLSLLYSEQLEFVVGRACSVQAVRAPGTRRAMSVRTEWLPTTDVPQTKAVGAENSLMSMAELAAADVDALTSGLAPLIDGYTQWISSQRLIAATLPIHLKNIANDPLDLADWTLDRLRQGLAMLGADSDSGSQARKAFVFMNRAMRDQRIRSEVSLLRTSEPSMTVAQAIAEVEARGASAASWRPFQLAFIIKQLPSIVEPWAEQRSSDVAAAELLFFPTGGGKTEAYLGLAAFTFAIRRLQGIVESSEGPLDGNSGVAVLMRYTLRLLTSQQFVRATTLMCAAEVIRKEDEETWGDEPFRIGLWVGTSVSPKVYEEAKSQIVDARAEGGFSHGLTVLQVKRCPWCGTSINPKSDLVARDDLRRIHVFCGDVLGQCEFSKAKSPEGLPLLTVDEEIYRFPPAFLLATVDKFSRLSREGQSASLFGYVRERCERHGYRHADSNEAVCSGAAQHNAKPETGLPAASAVPAIRLRPPDLIIQDELHLISGALGTAVGLFESAIDVVSTWTTADGKKVKPLIVASTATVRNAKEQVRRLYGRGIEVFPPQVIDVRDTYFSKEVPADELNPARRYMGVCAPGIRMIIAQIQIFTIMMLGGQKLLDEHGDDADAYMTAVAYFNATRELAGMRRHLDDSVTTAVSDGRTVSGLKRRTTGQLTVGELTSRISSSEIAETLDKLGFRFDPESDSTAARDKWASDAKAAKAAGKKMPKSTRTIWPFDVVLATSMLQVGVDVPRLGLMLVVGQPKNTAEYIQASSRVGRSATEHGPGLVLTLANWARPRDMAHFEQFDYYHRTFYSFVEPLSVTPFSDASLDRGLTAVLVSCARIFDAVTPSPSLSPNEGASFAHLRRTDVLDRIVAAVVSRSEIAASSQKLAQVVGAKLVNRIDQWAQRSQTEGLSYSKKKSKTQNLVQLLVSPEERVLTPEAAIFRVPNSMREVQPEINLISPPSMLAPKTHGGAPKWGFRSKTEGEADE